MAVARYKDLCIDATGSEDLGRFWARVLGLRFEPNRRTGTLTGSLPEQRIWMNEVPEAKTVKHRVHLDVHTAAVDELVGLGATVLEPAEEFGRAWTVLADPEGGEFCAFFRDLGTLASYRLYEIAVDAMNPQLIAAWWAEVLGATVGGREDKGWWWLEDVPGLPFDGWVFGSVPEPKTVKNRIHWDVTVDSVDDLVSAGAVIVRDPDDEIFWTICADLEGNEFCAFTVDE